MGITNIGERRDVLKLFVAGLVGSATTYLITSKTPTLLEGAHFAARAYSLSSKGKVIGKCAVGNVELGLVPYESFPSERMDCMILNWSGPIYTYTDTPDNPDPNTQLKFPVDAVYVKVDERSGKMVVTDIIPDIRPGAGTTRQPSKDSQLVILFPAGQSNGLKKGTSLVAKRLPFNIQVPVPQ